MAQRFQFAVVKYVPNVARDEAVNVGVIVRSIEGDEFAFRFLPRAATVRKLWPDSDDKLVRNFSRELDKAKASQTPITGIGHPADHGFFDRMASEFNGNLQLTAIRGIASKDLDRAIEETYSRYVAEPQGGPRPINYQSIAPFTMRERVWRAFEKRDLVRPGLLKKQIVVKGSHAPWTFDLGYMNGRLDLWNSVALNADTSETNLGRALVYKGMLEEVRLRNGKGVRGTAIVQTPKKDGAGSGEAMAILEDARIAVVDIVNLGDLVEEVGKRLAR